MTRLPASTARAAGNVFAVLDGGLRGSYNFDTSVIQSKFGYVLDSPGRTGRVLRSAVAKAIALSRNDDKLAAYIENFRSTGAKVAEETGCQIETRVILDYPAFHTRDDSDCIRLIRMAFKDLGIASTVEDGAGGFDANRLSRCGIELVGLATGYTANHTVPVELPYHRYTCFQGAGKRGPHIGTP